MEYERDPQSTDPVDRDVPPSAEWLRLTKYLLGELDAAGCAEVEGWIARGPVRAPVVASLRKAWQAPVVREAPVDSAAALARVIEQVQRRRARQVPAGSLLWSGSRRETPRQRMWYALAGAMLAVVTIVVGWHVGPRRHGAHMGVPSSAYITGNGERANVTLPDGGTVVLNVASRLEVPADYLAGDHTLRLSGEALFTVQHHSGIPFIVVADQTTTQVLGTSFVMRHYASDSVTMVAVRDGKVAVGATVVPAERLVEVRRNGRATLRPTTPAQFSFATGTLTLDEVKLPEAIPELDRWYDADIRLGDPALASQGVLGGKFAAGSLNDLAMNLELALDVRVKRDGRVLTLFPKR